MVNVGTKDLKNRLSHYLRLVREGERVIVCDRGKVVAELRSASAPADDNDSVALAKLASEGAVVVRRGRLGDFSPVRPQRRARLSTIVIEDRG
jgi:prevent-host-death family protein